MELDKNLKLTTIIFDLDGTLHHLPIDYAALRKPLGIADTDEKIGDAIQRLVLADDPRIEAVTKAELDSVKGETLSDPVQHALSKLQEHDFNLAVFTRNSRKVVEQLIEGTSLEDKLFIVGREDVRHLKPHHEGADLILGHFDATPEQAALVGDTTHDVQAARATEVLSIVVKNELLKFMPEDADYYIDSIPHLLTLLGVSHEDELLWP